MQVTHYFRLFNNSPLTTESLIQKNEDHILELDCFENSYIHFQQAALANTCFFKWKTHLQLQ